VEFSDILTHRIQPPDGKFRDKDSLKKTAADLSGLQFEMLCVASLENDLNETQLTELNEILAVSEDKRRIAAIISRTKLNPPEIRFRNKSRLKRLTLPQKALRLSVIGISAAAAVFLLFTVIRKPVIPLHENQASVTIAEKKDKPENAFRENTVKNETEKRQTIADADGAVAGTGAIVHMPVTTSFTASLPVSEDVKDSVAVQAVYRENTPGKLAFKADIAMAELKGGNELVAINIIRAEPLAYENKPGLNESIARFFREKILKTENPEKGSLKAYEVADAGINGLNRIFGWNMKLEKKKDEKGEVNSVYFNSRLLKFNAPVKKSETAE
jgi:hypothetical protein